MKALIVVDHGSKVSAANEMLEEVRHLLRFKTEAKDIMIEMAHMELAEPSIETVVEQCVKAGARHITVSPYMLSPGRHATKDIPNLAREAVDKIQETTDGTITLEITGPLGVHPLIAQVVLEKSGLEDATKKCPYFVFKNFISKKFSA